VVAVCRDHDLIYLKLSGKHFCHFSARQTGSHVPPLADTEVLKTKFLHVATQLYHVCFHRLTGQILSDIDSKDMPVKLAEILRVKTYGVRP
jgi:hypothetical protein